MNDRIKNIIKEIISMLKEKYPELEALNRFNSSLKIHELVINDNKNYRREILNTMSLLGGDDIDII